MRASIVIPLYDQLELTRQCVASLLETGLGDDVELVLVDNASTDGTRDYLATLGDAATVVLQPTNTNFAGACNEGARRARGEVLVFLNNDTVVTPGWLDALLAALEDERVGCVGARLLYPDGTVQHAGVAFGDDLIGFHLYAGAARDDERVVQTRDLQAVTGACMALPRALYRELGGFDEAYRNGAEDLDLCMRVLAAGRIVRYEPSCVVFHHESRSVGRFAHARANIALFLARWGDAVVPDAHAFADGGHVARGARVPASPLSFADLLDDDAIDIVRVPAGGGVAAINAQLAHSVARRFAIVPPDAPLGDADVRAIAGQLPVAGGPGEPHVALALAGDELPVVAFTRTVLDRIGGFDARFEEFPAQLHDFVLRAQACRFAIVQDGSASALESLAARRGGEQVDMRLFLQRWANGGRRSTPGVVPASALVMPDAVHYAPLIDAAAAGAEAAFDTRAHALLLAYEPGFDAAFEAAARWAFDALAGRDDATIVVRAGDHIDRVAALLESAIAHLRDEQVVDVVLADAPARDDAALCAIADAVVCGGLESYALHGIALHAGIPVLRAGDDAALRRVLPQAGVDAAAAAAA